MTKARYQKFGHVVYGLPFKNGEYGIKIVRGYVRVYPLEPIIRMRKLSAAEKAEAVS